MTSVLFTFNEAASEQAQDDLGKKLMSEGVEKVGRINPAAKRPSLRRMWYAEVADEKAAALAEKLNGLSEIEIAELPAERNLLE